jgi:hypothetical protein
LFTFVIVVVKLSPDCSSSIACVHCAGTCSFDDPLRESVPTVSTGVWPSSPTRRPASSDARIAYNTHAGLRDDENNDGRGDKNTDGSVKPTTGSTGTTRMEPLERRQRPVDNVSGRVTRIPIMMNDE